MTQVTFEPGARLRRLEAELRKPEKILRQIGALLVSESQAAFKKQRLGRKRWRERKTPNVFGILADFALGRPEPAARRFESRPALMDTGRLRASIAFKVQENSVTVGSNLDYAAVHQTGGETRSVKITRSMQEAIAKWIRRAKKSASRKNAEKSGSSRKGRAKMAAKAAAPGLGWLVNAKWRNKQLTTQVPARPFVGVTVTSKRSIGKAIGAVLTETDV